MYKSQELFVNIMNIFDMPGPKIGCKASTQKYLTGTTRGLAIYFGYKQERVQVTFDNDSSTSFEVVNGSTPNRQFSVNYDLEMITEAGTHYRTHPHGNQIYVSVCWGIMASLMRRHLSYNGLITEKNLLPVSMLTEHDPDNAIEQISQYYVKYDWDTSKLKKEIDAIIINMTIGKLLSYHIKTNQPISIESLVNIIHTLDRTNWQTFIAK